MKEKEKDKSRGSLGGDSDSDSQVSLWRGDPSQLLRRRRLTFSLRAGRGVCVFCCGSNIFSPPPPLSLEGECAAVVVEPVGVGVDALLLLLLRAS